MFVCNFLIASKKYASVCVFAGAKWRSGAIAKSQFLTPANWGVATFSLQNAPESAGDGGIFPFFYFAMLNLVFELKQNLEAQPYPEMNP